MRIRQVKPAFWSDATIARLGEATRLCYIGTWCLADDAGFLDADVSEIGHALYGYEARQGREKKVARMIGELVKAGRVIDHGCGHLEVPTMVGHQHLAGSTKQVRTVQNDHLRRCISSIPADPREDPRDPAAPRPGNGQVMVSNGTVRSGQSTARAGVTAARLERLGEMSEFERLVPRPGAKA